MSAVAHYDPIQTEIHRKAVENTGVITTRT
jgi:hypothetical protein